MIADDSGIMKASLTMAPTGTAFAALRAIAVIAIVLATFGLLWPTTVALAHSWSDTAVRAYTHGVLIVPLACFIVWRRRAVLAATPARPSWLACAATALACLVWLVSFRSGIQIGHEAMLPIICGGIVAGVFGIAMARTLLLPIAFLYFAIPVWDILVPLLQWASAYAVRGMVSLVGIPVHFDGLEFQIPAGRFEIAGGCSGLHFFIVALVIATLYGEIHADRPGTRVKLLVFAAALALITNWIRIAIIIVVGHESQMQHPLVANEHYTFGWYLFAAAMAIFFLVVRRWPATDPAAVDAPAESGPALPWRGAAITVAILGACALTVLLDANVASPERVPAAPAHHVPGWTRVAAEEAGAPRFINADRVDAAEYHNGDSVVQVFGAVYLQQRQGRELADFGNRPLGEGFAPASGFAVVAGGRWLEVRARDRARRNWLVRLRYRVDDATFTGVRRSQLAYGLASLIGDPVASALILRSPCASSDCADARTALDEFLLETMPGSVTP